MPPRYLSFTLVLCISRHFSSQMDAKEVEKITVVATGAIPWRSPGVTYKTNQIWVDVTEKMSVLISHEGLFCSFFFPNWETQR